MIKILKIQKLKTIFLLVAIGYWLISARPAAAQEMKNGFYIIQMGNLNSIAGISGSEDYKINITSGETAPNLNIGTNYKVRAGFQYVLSGKAVFSLSLSNSLIDFGTLSPTNPITRTTLLTISNLAAPGYNITASENHQLLVPKTGAIIPDTTCDSGTCNQTNASIWESSLTYGFGYRCDPIAILSKGVKDKACLPKDLTFYYFPSHYKQFADSSKSEPASTIISGTRGRNQKATVTYKVNIPSSQASGLYTNAITYIMIPTF